MITESMVMTKKRLTPSEAPPPPTPLAGLGVAAVLVTAIIVWVALGSTFLSESSLFGGFLMLWYWGKVENLSMSRLPATVLGALVGIGIAWVMFYSASNYGPAGFAFGLFVLIVAIYLDVIQVFPMFVNASTMLLSIIAAAPLVQLKVNWVELCLATLGGGVFFGVYVAVLSWLAGKVTQRSA
jgi:hypothetical protein